jgi:hypothetical protein
MFSHACICNPLSNKTYPAYWNPDNCHYSKNDSIARYFNSGMFLLRPNLSELLKMENFLVEKKDLTSYKFADQDFLNEYFHDFAVLPYIYNSLKTFSITHSDIWDLAKIKNIHYILDKYFFINIIDLGMQIWVRSMLGKASFIK